MPHYPADVDALQAITFFEGLLYLGSASLFFFFPDPIGLYMLDLDPFEGRSEGYIQLTFLSVAAIGLGYLPGLFSKEIAWHSLFNRLLLGVFALILYGAGKIEIGLTGLVLVVDSFICLICWYFLLRGTTWFCFFFCCRCKPAKIAPDQRKLLWQVPAAEERTLLGRLTEVEGYIGLISGLLFTIPAIAKPVFGLDDFQGMSEGHFSTIPFFMAQMYWFWVPAARLENQSVLMTSVLQRVLLMAGTLGLWYIDAIEGGFAGVIIFFNFITPSTLAFLALWSTYIPFNEDVPFAKLKKSLKWWLVSHGVAVMASSAYWMIFSSNGSPGMQKYLHDHWIVRIPRLLPFGDQRMMVRVHRFDIMLGILIQVLGFLFDLIPEDGKKFVIRGWTIGPRQHLLALSLLIPYSSWWFSIESKIIVHLGGGSPFHMSWVKDGMPMWTNPLVDATFFIGTISMWVSTTYLMLLLLFYIGNPLGAFKENPNGSTWQMRVRNSCIFYGTLIMLISCVWMIGATSGVPPFIPPVFKGAMLADPFKCVRVHILDLVTGIGLLVVGVVFSLLPDAAKPITMLAAKGLAVVPLLYSLLLKVMTNMNGGSPFFPSYVLYNLDSQCATTSTELRPQCGAQWTSSPSFDAVFWVVTMLSFAVYFLALCIPLWYFRSYAPMGVCECFKECKAEDDEVLLADAEDAGKSKEDDEVLLADAVIKQPHTSMRRNAKYTLVWHGFGMILLSCVWIMATNCGIPAIMPSTDSDGDGMWAPPFLPGDKRTAARIHSQDMMIGLFTAAAGLVLEILPTDPRHVQNLAWMLPVGGWWFTIEIKIMCNLGGGTPFHQSWVLEFVNTAGELYPQWTSDFYDITFWGATMMLTALTTSYVAFVILLSVFKPARGRGPWRAVTSYLIEFFSGKDMTKYE